MNERTRHKLKNFVRRYLQERRLDERRFFMGYAAIRTFDEALRVAASGNCPNTNTRHSHQRRLKQAAINAGSSKLLKSKKELQQCNAFDSLLTVVEGVAAKVKGIGELYVYDTTTRIGAKLGLYPEYVYLHAGTRDGAKKLGLNSRGRYLRIEQMPREMQKLNPYEMEDVLCLYAHCDGNCAKLDSICCGSACAK